MSERGPVGGAGELTVRAALELMVREVKTYVRKHGVGPTAAYLNRALVQGEAALAAKAPQGVPARVGCKCDPEYAHRCAVCGGKGYIDAPKLPVPGPARERTALLWLKENIGPKLDYQRAKTIIADALLPSPVEIAPTQIAELYHPTPGYTVAAPPAPLGVPAAEVLYGHCREIIENKNHPSNGVREAYQALLAMVRPSSEGGGLAANPGYPAPESTGGPQKMAVLPVPGPVSDDTIHHGIFPPRMFAPVLQEHQDKAINILRPYISGSEFGEVVALVAQAIADAAREAAAPKPAPAPTSCNASPVETEEGAGSATRYATSPSSAQDKPTPAPGAERALPFRKVIEWLHHTLAAAQNTPYEEGDVCEDCTNTVLDGLVPLVREALAAAPPATCECGRAKRLVCEHCFGNGAADYTRHASAERVRELIAKWRSDASRWEIEPDGKTWAPEQIKHIATAHTRRCADELERALPPSTGEKVSGATSPAKDGDAT